jgi:hypothetical protein
MKTQITQTQTKVSMKDFIKSGSYLIDEVKSRAEKNSSHFFDADSMRFFSSRISELAFQQGGSSDASYKTKDIYFITSEQDRFSNGSRGYTVRCCDKNGDIETITGFQMFNSVQEARKEIKQILEAL